MAMIFVLVFISVCLTGEIYSGFLGKLTHLCEYKKEETNSVSVRSCGGMNERLCRRFFGYDDTYKDCCAGWTNKGLFGCHKKTCIVLPQDATIELCKLSRHLKLQLQKSFYKLTTPPEEPLAYPNETQDLFKAVSFPLLDQPSQNVVLRSVFLPNLHEQEWVVRYLGMAQRNKKFTKEYLKNLEDFTKYSEYDVLLKTYRDEQSKPLISVDIPGTNKDFGILPMKDYMKYPSQDLPFKDIIQNEAWQNDDVFVQQRLAGLNPMALRKMKIEDFNQEFVNKTYDWDAAIQRASGGEATVEKLINAGKVFIIDYKLLYDVSNVEDYTERNTTDRREMKESRSPFCMFVSAKVGGVNELKAVAIQSDLTSDAPVFSPIDGAKWLMAKQEIQRADITYAELIEHLLKTHLVLEPICVIMRRTLSSYHPLYQHLQWICRGVFVTNSLGIKALLLPDEFLHKLFTIGHVGATEVLNKAYPFVSWADTEFDKNLERRGVNNVRELPYFPYRDDGLLFWKEVGGFTREYVHLYYMSDGDVTGDTELQDFANQLSADGTGTNGGSGMLKGFPAKIKTKSELVDVVKRITFIPVQHSAVNYPVVYYGAFIPNMPTKLYDDPRVPAQEFGFHTLPQAHVASEQVSLAMSLGSLRYDVIFDYGPKMEDDRAKTVVNKYHKRLTGSVNAEITARNKKRLDDGKMTYPYFLPKWVTNSIHT